MSKKKLGEILLEMGAIDPLQLQSALGYQQQWGVPLGKAVVHNKFCSEDDVLRALSIQTGLPVIRLDGMEFDPTLAHVVPVRSAERFRAVPIRLEGKRKEILVVAVGAPGGLETTDNLLSVSGKQRLAVHLAHDEEIERAIGKLYYGRVPEKPVGLAVDALEMPVGIANEEVIEFDPTPVAAQLRPVRIFGWHEASMRALKAMIERGGIQAIPLEDDALSTLQPEDVLVASTLGLHAALPAGARVPSKLIICGVKGDVDVTDAKTIGARIYLRPPFSTEQLCNAIRRAAPR